MYYFAARDSDLCVARSTRERGTYVVVEFQKNRTNIKLTRGCRNAYYAIGDYFERVQLSGDEEHKLIVAFNNAINSAAPELASYWR